MCFTINYVLGILYGMVIWRVFERSVVQICRTTHGTSVPDMFSCL